MRFLIFLRDKVFPYILFIAIIGGGLGGIAWLIATTYFWNTSQLTVLVADDVASAEIHISARVIYQDFQVFGVLYPFHMVFPWSTTIECHKECVFSSLPPGEAEITFVSKGGVSGSEHIVVVPDTYGKIDLRPVILTREIASPEGIGLVASKKDVLPTSISRGAVFYSNLFQGLFLFWDDGILFLYDTAGKQSIMLPQKLAPKSIMRGIGEGEYYLVTDQDEVWIYDRYGRKKTEKVSHSATAIADLVWESAQTKLKIGDKEQLLPGRFFWFEYEKKYFLFDGDKVFEIINT